MSTSSRWGGIAGPGAPAAIRRRLVPTLFQWEGIPRPTPRASTARRLMSTSSRRGGIAAFGAMLALALVCLLVGASPAWASIADQVGATFGLMLQEVVAAFPAVEGLVVAAEGDRLFMDLTEKNGVQPGQEFTVFRKGEAFHHVLTGKPLGRYEEILGYAQVQRVLPRYSEAVFVPVDGKPRPHPEDGVRITRGRIRVAVASVTDLTRTNADLRRVPFMIAHALDQTKRFQSADPSTVREFLLNQKIRGEELLVRPDKAVAVARTLEVTGWLIPVLLERRGVTYLDVTWVSGITGAALFSRRLALVRADTTAEQRFPWEPLPED
ncbi:MAG TPA: hypothetical protein VFN71_14520 [Methylomirabilota bacterium]|nr:hypothetical protein [Methylomirabilota bacterium]